MAQSQTDVEANRKNSFITWLSTVEGKKISELAIVGCYDAAFEYAQKHGITKTSIWAISDIKAYNSIRSKLSASRLFRFTHRSVFSSFEKMGKYYAMFLNETENGERQSLDQKADPKIETKEVEIKKDETIAQELVGDIESERFDTVGTQSEEVIIRHKIPDNRITVLFKEWLEIDQRMATASARGYSSAIKTINEWAISKGIWSESIFDLSVEDAKKYITMLFCNALFPDFNSERHNQFSAALTKYISFLDVLDQERTPVMNDTQLSAAVKEILREKYPYGYKYDSIREAMRFRRFAEEREIVLPESDEELKTLIVSVGDVIEGKAYARNDNLQDELKQVVETLYNDGIRVIYYESFLNHEWALMERYHITTEELLKEYLQKCISGFCFAKRFMCAGRKNTEAEAVSQEMLRVWGEEATCSFNSLINSLLFIPAQNIQRVLFANSSFIWVSDGVYLYLDRFVINEEERSQILDFVDRKCIEQGFASLSDIPLGHIEVANYNLSPYAIQTAIYQMVLSRYYKLNGKILTKKASRSLDIVTIIKHEYAGRDNCSLEDVANRVAEILGASNRQSAFKALYDDYVRANRDRFVSNRNVEFLIEEIDKALSRIFVDRFGAIKQVTTFSNFPICGIPWNHYVLESYCYKYSRKYSLHIINFNSKNAGIIAEKTYHKSYDEMLAITIAKANVKLEKEAVLSYLVDHGFLAKNSYGRIDRLLKRAQDIREG